MEEKSYKQSYIKQLNFQSKLKKGIVWRYLTNPRLVILLILALVGIGMVSYFNLPRNLNPEVEIPIIVVSSSLPGAGPEEVESLVTVPIEDSLESIAKVTTLSSTSSNSFSNTFLEFESSVDPDEAKSEVKSAIDSLMGLPEDASDPIVNKLDFEDQPIWYFAITGDVDYPSLVRFSEKLEEELKNLTEIDRVNVDGINEEEIQIVLKPETIQQYKLSPIILSQAIKTATQSYPAGDIEIDHSIFSLSIDPTVSSEEDLRNLRINLGQGSFRLADLADVKQQTKPNLLKSYYSGGEGGSQATVSISVYRNKSIDIDKAIVVAQETVEKLNQDYNNQFTIVTTLDFADMISEQFTTLVNNFAITLALVFLVLFVFLGARQAIITSLTIPITFLSAFIVMGASGISINFLSLFSLLLALGLLIDDAIVIVSAMNMYFRSKKFTAEETGRLVWRDFITPIWTTTITTVWAFLPLLLASGITGEFIRSIPIVVSAVLISSTAVAVLITLPLMIMIFNSYIPRRVIVLFKIVGILTLILGIVFILPKTPAYPILAGVTILGLVIFWRKKPAKRIWEKYTNANLMGKAWDIFCHGLVDFGFLTNKYRQIIDKILSKKSLRKKVVWMVIIFSVFSYALVPIGFVQNEFFPKTDEDSLYIDIELPVGTSIDKMEEATLVLLEDIRQLEELKFVTADIGRNFSEFEFSNSAGANTALYTVILQDADDRERSSIEIAEDLRNRYRNYEVGDVRVQEISGGPPAGADIQIKFLGLEIEQLDSLAEQTMAHLKEQEGVINIEKSIEPGTSKITFVPDQDTLASNGLTVDAIGLWLRNLASGFKLDTLKLNGEEQDITFRLEGEPNMEQLNSLSIPTPTGYIPVKLLGKFVLETNPTAITRENGKRSLSVTAAVKAGVSPAVVNAELEEFADTLLLPDGYIWKTGGLNEENQKSVNSIIQAMGLAALLIFSTMLIQLGSFRKAGIILLVIPLAVSGVFVAFAITGTNLSFPALIGILALFGIVVNNSIVVVDKINLNRKSGIKFKEAIVDASSGRLEAITLSSLTTIAGLIPITLSDPLWEGLGGAIIYGLLLSGTIMLFLIPIVYYSWMKGTEKEPIIK